MKRCLKCILPENYPGIEFNDHGICSRCQEWELQYSQTDYSELGRKLDLLIEACKEKARLNGVPYDVIVPISGGKDSAYVLYVMKELYNCRVLAINYHNTMQSELAYRNVIQLINTFDVDFRMLTIQPSLLKRAYHESMKRLNEFCLICNCTGYWIFLSFLDGQFSRYGYVPMVVGGWSRKYEYDPQINTLDFQQYRNILEESGLIDEFCQTLDRDVLDDLTFSSDIRQQNSEAFIQLPDFREWDHHEILRILKMRGWQPMKDKDTHFDCWASPLADKLETLKYGLNQRSTIAATMVRAGKLNRENAIMAEELSLYEPIDWNLTERFAKHINCTLEEYETLRSNLRS